MDPGILQAWSDEMAKLSVVEWWEASQRPALRVAAPPSPGGETPLTLKNVGAELRRRYPNLTVAQRQAAMADEMAKRLGRSGVRPDHVAMFMGPDLTSSAMKGVRPGRPATIHIGGSNPLTIGHEAGHVRDYAKRGEKFFGERGFFGMGGDAASTIPSEVSASKQAIRAYRGATRRELAQMAAATGTYLEAAGVPGREAYERALSSGPRVKKRQQAAARAEWLGDRLAAKSPGLDELTRRVDRVSAARGRRKARYDKELLRLRAKHPGLESSFGEAPKIRRWALLHHIEERRRAAGRRPSWKGGGPDVYSQGKGLDRLLARRQAQLEADPDAASLFRQAKSLDRWRYLHPTQTLTPKEQRYAKGRARAYRLSRRLSELPNPFKEEVEMSTRGRRDVRRYVRNVGEAIGKRFGDDAAKAYLDEVLGALKKPTLRGLRFLATKKA